MPRSFMLISIVLMLFTACSPTSTAPLAPANPTVPANPTATLAQPSTPELRIMTHDSFAISKDVIAEFEQQAGVKVVVLPSGDAGAALNKAILAKQAPLADLFYGVDNTFLSRALAAEIFEPYAAPALATIPTKFKLDASNQLLPIDVGYVTINYDKGYMQQHSLTAPANLRDLTKPEWKGKLVVENPTTSSPGLAFMLATIATFGVDGSYTWLDYWRELRANDVLVVEGWSAAYYTQFSGSSGQGPRPLVVSYATSPAAEVFFSEGKLSEPPTANLLDGSFEQIEYVGILKGTKQRSQAERFIDFMLSKRFQEDIPLQMFVYPVLPGAALPAIFTTFAPIPAQVATIAPATIDQNRESWLATWTKVVLR